MPIIDEVKSRRPGQGYDGDAARNLRVHHECWRHFLRPFIQNKNARVILYGDGKARQTLHSIGAVLGDSIGAVLAPLGLPAIPLDRSGISVHSILRPEQVQIRDLFIAYMQNMYNMPAD